MKKMFFATLMIVCFTAIMPQPASAKSSCFFNYEDMPTSKEVPDNFSQYWEAHGSAHSVVFVKKMSSLEKQKEEAEKRAYKLFKDNYKGWVERKNIKVLVNKINPENEGLVFGLHTPLPEKK